ncbi:uncharacterized protein LOC125220408 [Salvia hispanica]|uniref:uncharacterized protein LOC125220408 n=1 Tax=Salvia hispanica TaxID=49212 RepID=UPI00200908CD|nr:uncharacterized protein LOC125220408 [Salvia hispanica]
MTPFKAVYGRAPPIVVPYEIRSSLLQEVDVELRSRDEVLRELKANLELARQQQKIQADKGKRTEEFAVGDWVYLKLHPYRQQTIFRCTHQKLANKSYGPFQVSKRIGSVTYELDLPPTSRVHPVFHVSLLRRRIGDKVESVPLPPLIEIGFPSD